MCHVHGLQAPANSEVQQEREKTEGQRLHVRDGEGRDLRVDVQTAKKGVEKPHGRHQERRHDNAEINAVDEGAVTVFALASAEGLRDKGIEANEKAAAEEGQDIEKVGTDADRTDGAGAVRKVADHDRVHNTHAHPADFGENQRQSEPDRGSKFVAKCLEADHVRARGEESVSGGGTGSK